MNAILPARLRVLVLVVLSGLMLVALMPMTGTGQQPNSDSTRVKNNSELPRSNTTQQRAPADIALLIKQLGVDSFAARQRAEKQLLEIGTPAKAQLTAALTSDDAELRQRTQRILKTITQRERAQQRVAFRRGHVAQPPENGESWQELAQLWGDTMASRELFLKMQDAAGELLNLREQNQQRCAVHLEQIVDQCGRDLRAGLPSVAVAPRPLMTAVVFAAGDKRVPMDKLIDRLQLQLLILQKDVRARFVHDSHYQRLLGRWIENKGNDAEGTERSTFFRITRYYELEEGAQLARQTLREEHTPIVTGRAALVLGQLGNVDDIPLLEKSIENNEPIGRRKQRDELGVVGDIALAMCVVLSGQEPQDYGCKRAPSGRPAFEKGSYLQYRFDKGDEDKRQAARAKWRNWRAANKLDPSEPAPTDSKKRPSAVR